MPVYEPTFEELLRFTLMAGETRTDRTGTGTVSVFAPPPLRFDLSGNKLALITSKQVAWKMALREFMWMLSGSTDVGVLRSDFSAAMANIWDNWADEAGSIGPTYGAQYRNAGGYDRSQVYPYGEVHGVDQLAEAIDRLARTPDTRRALISLWSAVELNDMGIEPCMVLFQFSLRGPNLNELHLHVYQRSADMMLGVPFDLFQASVLAHLVARELTFETGRFHKATSMTWQGGDVHIYNTHTEAAKQQLLQAQNAPRMNARLVIPHSPELRLLNGSLTPSHIDVASYHAAPGIRAGAIAV